MDNLDLRLLKTVQDGINLTKRPFLEVGDDLGISEDQVIRRLNALMEEGVIRRFAATIGHRALGIVANAMIVWKVPDCDVERVGGIMASFEEVTHCYERATHPEWPYNIYTVIHSHNRDDCIRIASNLSKAAGLEDYKILFSEHEYKKTSARI